LIAVPYRNRQTTYNLITALCVASRGKKGAFGFLNRLPQQQQEEEQQQEQE